MTACSIPRREELKSEVCTCCSLRWSRTAGAGPRPEVRNSLLPPRVAASAGSLAAGGVASVCSCELFWYRPFSYCSSTPSLASRWFGRIIISDWDRVAWQGRPQLCSSGAGTLPPGPHHTFQCDHLLWFGDRSGSKLLLLLLFNLYFHVVFHPTPLFPAACSFSSQRSC